MLRRLQDRTWRFLDSILPSVPSDADYPANEEEAAGRRWRLWFIRQQKQGHGGNR